ncbi:MAG: efflux RND transporter periplasmic adaptor subunit [Gemmatimonadaceae bacterium]
MRATRVFRVAMAITTTAAAAAACNRSTDDAPGGTGTVEVAETDVGPAAPARVVRVWVQEGDRVERGDTLVALAQAALPADIEGRRSRVALVEASLRDLQVGARPAEVARADADVHAAEAEATRTERDLQRMTTLAANAVVSQQTLDAATSAARSATARRDAARAGAALVREGARDQRVSAARAEVASARAALAGALATQGDLVLLAPSAGTILGRYVEPGEMLAAGTPAVTVGDLARPWVRVYVAARDLPRVRVGSAASATLAGAPAIRFAGRVVAISDRAEFTPRVALTEREREDLLFGVKVELQDSTGVLKPGLPATVVIGTRHSALGTRPPQASP